MATSKKPSNPAKSAAAKARSQRQPRTAGEAKKAPGRFKSVLDELDLLKRDDLIITLWRRGEQDAAKIARQIQQHFREKYPGYTCAAPTVRKVISDEIAKWRAARENAVEDRQAEQEARLMLIYQNALTDYHTQMQTRFVRDDEGNSTEVKEPVRNPNLLKVAITALQDIRKMYGDDAPTKVAPTTPDGKKEWQPERVREMSESELEALVGDFASHIKPRD